MLNVNIFKFSRENIVNTLLSLSLLGMALWSYASGDNYTVNLISRVTIFAIAGVGLNMALGFGGMISFGHAAFFGIGGYVAGIASSHAFDQSLFISWPFEIGGTDQMIPIWIMAVITSTLAAALIGVISLRTSGVYFIMITLAFAQMIYYFAISWPTYGGEDGLSIYLRNQLPIGDMDQAISFFAVCFISLLLIIALCGRIMGSRFGAALTTARMNDVRLATAGIAPLPIKLTGFIISAMITGFAGALYADLNGFVSPSMLSWHMSGQIMIFVILGGIGRLFGPVIGAMIFVLLETYIGGWTDYWQFFLGLVLLGAVLFAKGGIIGLLAGKAQHD